ncbi:glycoside hydrolase family 3 N-terminal domain-containing protein [Armatimonas rosea]|uniref:Beta-glucosidase-like glycosyl hydrolase n=1 Tax=Armatimonas rosea TaxID=685828 RepID=A0A7W9W6H9_ARMRO|nr:beta-glucosidase-like glycosyl hydrolase [Armatimonas rosea]
MSLTLSLEERVGQLCCFGWHGRTCLDEQARVCVQELHAGAMVVMGRNLHDTTQRPLPQIDAPAVRAMLDALQALAKTPLLIATDQEGGRVARFGTAPFTPAPAAAALESTEAAYASALQTGRELATVGVNMNFAPVADINSNPENPVIGDRSFGTTPEAVTPKLLAQLQGYTDSGILSCLKHFPGHGDTSTDSHFLLPTLPHTLATLEARELAPFRAGIAAGAPAVMTAHILFPALDTALPATMSPAILTGLLRETLGFQGLIVTDCLEMRAVADHWGTAQAALAAVKAGADLVLVCHTLERQRETYETLLAAARSGELSEARLNEAVTRVLAAKARVTSVPFDPTLLGGTQHATAATTLGSEAPRLS